MSNEPFHVLVNGGQEFNLLPEDAQNLDLIPDADGQFHILHKGKAYRAEVLETNPATHEFLLRVNGIKFSIKVADRYDRLIQQLGLHVGGHQKINAVKAPMPGLVLNILVSPGQAVEKGEPLLILEAMKMENVIKAAGEGVVKAIPVQKGAAVDKGQLLIEME